MDAINSGYAAHLEAIENAIEEGIKYGSFLVPVGCGQNEIDYIIKEIEKRRN